MFQQTIKKNIQIKGVGLHNGKNVTLNIKPESRFWDLFY